MSPAQFLDNTAQNETDKLLERAGDVLMDWWDNYRFHCSDSMRERTYWLLCELDMIQEE